MDWNVGGAAALAGIGAGHATFFLVDQPCTCAAAPGWAVNHVEFDGDLVAVDRIGMVLNTRHTLDFKNSTANGRARKFTAPRRWAAIPIYVPQTRYFKFFFFAAA